jgi:hypothetical protein
MSNFEKCNIEFSKKSHFLICEHKDLVTEILNFICDQPQKSIFLKK